MPFIFYLPFAVSLFPSCTAQLDLTSQLPDITLIVNSQVVEVAMIKN